MAEIIPVTRVIEEPSFIFITPTMPYLQARAHADLLAEKHNLVVASMPQLIRALKSYEAQEAISDIWADTVSGEYLGDVRGDHIYAVAHGMGPFSGTDRLKKGWSKITGEGYMPLEDGDPLDEGELEFLMQSHPLYHLEDLKAGERPEGNYVVFVRLNKDAMNKHESGRLTEHEFMNDDIVLMRTGSLEDRTTLLRCFKNMTEGIFGNHHEFDEWNFNQSGGSPLYVDFDNAGIYSNTATTDYGRFVGVEVPKAPEHQTTLLEKKIKS